ncbi:MAG: hypothetical protein J6A73_07845 [Lachnospiraceae bacterium]|nr:hypothetical protein [Lachnospiraceae bacterium]
MKKKQGIMLFLVVGILVLTGCLGGSNNGQNNASQGGAIQPGMQVVSLDVHSYAENEQGIYSVEYPETVRRISAQTNGELQIEALSGCTLPENLTEEEIEYLYNYITALPESDWSGDDADGYVFYVYFTYKVGSKEMKVSRHGYNAFPEGWDEFIAEVNRICGGDYLTGTGEIQRMDATFVEEVYGITDDDIVGCTLEEYLAMYHWEMGHAISENWILKDWVKEHNRIVAFEEHSSTELRNADSTEDEFQVMVYDYMNTLQETGEWTEMERGVDAPASVRYFRQSDGSGVVIMGRTADIKGLNLQEPGERIPYYRILCVENTDKYDLLPYAPFYYSNDDKFFLVCYNVEDEVISSFVQERSDDYYENLIATVLDESSPETMDMTMRLEDYPWETVMYYIGDYVPEEIVITQSTGKEYLAFLDAFQEKVGKTESGEPRLTEMSECQFDGFIGFWDINNDNLGDEIYIAPSIVLDDCEFELCEMYDKTYYCIADREGNPEGMVYSYNFIYSKDGKYIMIYDSHYTRLDILMSFIECEY